MFRQNHLTQEIFMSLQMPRREFIRTAGLSALGGAGLALSAGNAVAQAGATTARAPRLLVGLCAYSFRGALAKGTMNMEDFILQCVELGVNGADITVYWFKGGMDTVSLMKYRHFAFKNGMPFSGVACGPDLLQRNNTERQKAYDETKSWIDGAEALGASHLRVFGGALSPGMTEAQGIDFIVEAMKPLCDYAGKKGIALGIETHNGITQKADTTLEILRRVDNPYAGITLDITHFQGDTDEDLYKQIEACIPYATQTHIRPVFDKSRHPIDLDRVWQMFAKAGYRGYMSLEYEGGRNAEDPMTGVPKLIEQMKSLCKKYSSPAV
jgi:sugar phosphate isomerase/epimerase